MSEDGAGLDRRHFLLGAVGVGAGAMLTACTGNKKKAAALRPLRAAAAGAAGSNDAPGTAVTIGFSSPAADHGWTGAIAKNAASEAAKYSDVKLQTVQATNDVAAQIAGIQTLITKKVDVIVMLPYDGKQLTQVALTGQQAGIPVVNLDRVFDTPRASRIWIGGDNYGMGVSAGQYIGSTLKKKGVSNPVIGEIAGIDSLPLTQQRSQGFKDALAEFGFKVGPRQAAQFTAQSGQSVTAAMLAGDESFRRDLEPRRRPGHRRARGDQPGPPVGVLHGGRRRLGERDAADQGRQRRPQGHRALPADDGLLGDPDGAAYRPQQGDVRPRAAGGAGLDHPVLGHRRQDERRQVPPAGLRVLASRGRRRPQIGSTVDNDTKATLRVGMVGYAFMGAAHSLAWRTAGRVYDLPLRPAMVAICGRNGAAAAAAASRLGWESSTTDWKELIERDDIDLIDICTPGDTHAEIAIAALEAGKHVLCEKPVSNTVAEAEAMFAAAEAARQRGIRSMAAYNYRRVPALALARSLVADGKLGVIRHVRAFYLQDWIVDPEFPLVWRLRKDLAGSGALGDIGAHIVDLAQFILGDVLTGVSALTETFVKERPLPEASSGLSAVGGTRPR